MHKHYSYLLIVPENSFLITLFNKIVVLLHWKNYYNQDLFAILHLSLRSESIKILHVFGIIRIVEMYTLRFLIAMNGNKMV